MLLINVCPTDVEDLLFSYDLCGQLLLVLSHDESMYVFSWLSCPVASWCFLYWFIMTSPLRDPRQLNGPRLSNTECLLVDCSPSTFCYDWGISKLRWSVTFFGMHIRFSVSLFCEGESDMFTQSLLVVSSTELLNSLIAFQDRVNLYFSCFDVIPTLTYFPGQFSRLLSSCI